MQTVLFVLGALFVPIPPYEEGAEFDFGPDFYELTAELAVSVLPEPLRSFYQQDLGNLKSWARSPDKPTSSTITLRTDLAVCLDAGGQAVDRPARLASARRFPRTETSVRARYERSSCDRQKLPWAIQETFHSVLELFRSGVPRGSAESVAPLIHRAADAAMPFNTTSGEHFGVSEARRFLHERRARYHGELIRRLRKRLEVEAKIDPTRLTPTTKAVDAAFDTAIEAYQAIDPLLDIEAIVAEEVVAKPGEPSEKHEERFLEELSNRTYPILEARIEAGALLAANLLAGAWIEAGKPDATTVTDPAPQQTVQTPPSASTDSNAAFVGSKDSTVYHRASCAHAARIKPENRVSFESAEKAKAASRTPCKTCKPDAPSPP